MSQILIQESGRVLNVVLNRPEKRNALTCEMCSGIAEAVASAQDREDVGAILITATGSVFCAGMDLDEAAHPDHSRLASAHEELFTIGMRTLKPIIIAVNGSALGGGLGLVAQGHVVFASESAAFGLSEIRIGLWPFLVYRAIEAALGTRRTLELSLTGRMFHADDAFHWGLVHHVGPPAELLDRARGQARDIAKSSPAAIRAGMTYARDSRGRTLDEAGELAAFLRAQVMQGGDFQEGCAAFRERREPRWPSMPQEFYAEWK